MEGLIVFVASAYIIMVVMMNIERIEEFVIDLFKIFISSKKDLEDWDDPLSNRYGDNAKE